MENKTAPRIGCVCNVCEWARWRVKRDQQLEAELERNYQRYLAGLLVFEREAE